MTPPEHGTRKTKWIAAAAALSWAVLGLLWAQVLALPHPLLPPPSFAELLGRIPATPRPERFIVMLFKETSLLLTAYALLGLLMCALAGRAGARKSSLLATILCVTIAVASLVPVAQATKTASAEGVPLSHTRYFADLSPVPERFADRSPETVPYARSGGEVLKADVWEPPGEAKRPGRRSGPDVAAQGRPAVIVVHGGGWRSGERSDFPSWDAWLADEGYVVFDIDYRLSPPPSWRDAPSDVACAVGWVKENAARYGVDPERVALMGRSAGGHLALLTAYEEGRAATAPGCAARDVRDTGVAAVVAFYPPTDLSRLSSMGYLGGMDRFLGGSPGTVPGRYRRLSPVSHVDPGDPPTFLAYGGADRIVPPGQSELFAERLRGVGVPHRLVELPWANHTFDFLWGGWGSQITRYSLDVFLESNLKTPAEDAKTPGSFEHRSNGQRHEGGHPEKTPTSENSVKRKFIFREAAFSAPGRSFFDRAAPTKTRAHQSDGQCPRIRLRHPLYPAAICSTPMPRTRLGIKSTAALLLPIPRWSEQGILPFYGICR